MIAAPRVQPEDRRPAAQSDMTVLRANDAPSLELLFGPRSECMQLSPGPFAARAVQLQTDAIRVFSLSPNRGLQIRRWIPPETIALSYVTGVPKVLEHGRPWTPEDCLVVSGVEIDIASLEAFDMAWIEVDAAKIKARGGRELPQLPTGHSNLVSLKVNQHADMRALITGALSRHALEDRVLHALRRLLAGEQRTAPRPLLPKERELVRRAERIMWSNGEEPLTLQDLSAKVGCGARSLIYAFKAWCGMGPMRYLKTLRLNAVRRRLVETQGCERIFDVAADFGFWHMGHFTADYKRMFGITASETLDAARSSGSRLGKMGSALRLAGRDGELSAG